jgi:NADPH:quinone reductase-like Zn-dependent oxidoreductase
VRPKETVLIFGATGAVGTIAVQVAAHRGAHVIATASGAAATRLAKRLGAHRVIDARRRDSIEQLRKFAPDGVDAVLALAGGQELERCLDFVRPRGRVAHPNGIEPVPAARRSFHVRSYDSVASPQEFAKLNRHIVTHGIRVPIAATYPLSRAAQAHRRLENGSVIGRIVLRVA